MQMLIHGIHTDMVLDIMEMVTALDMEDIEDITDLMDMDTWEGRRGMLMLWQPPLLMLMQMLIHGIHTDMVLDIMDMVTALDMEDIEDITDLMDMDTWEGRRGMLML